MPNAKRSADAATIVSYPFGAFWGWILCHVFTAPLWVALLFSLVAAILSNVIAAAITRKASRA